MLSEDVFCCRALLESGCLCCAGAWTSHWKNTTELPRQDVFRHPPAYRRLSSRKIPQQYTTFRPGSRVMAKNKRAADSAPVPLQVANRELSPKRGAEH